MKKILSLCLMLTLCIGTASAKAPKKKTLATQVFTTDIVCHNCEQKIMNNVAVLGKGVEDVKVDVASKEVTVTYNTQKNSVENLVKGFSKISVKAEPKKACAEKKGCCGGCKKAAADGQTQGCCKKQAGCDKKPECAEKSEKACPAQKDCCKKQAGCEGKKAGCDKKTECAEKSEKACPAKKECCKKAAPAEGGKN